MIICADFDDTIFFLDDKAKTSINLTTIKKWRDLGNIFILATGRSLGSLERDLPNWCEYFNYLILDGGTKIIDTSTELLWSNTLNPPLVEKLLTIAKTQTSSRKTAFYHIESDDYALEQPDLPLTKVRFFFHNNQEGEDYVSKITDLKVNTFLWGDDPTSRYRSADLLDDYHTCVDVTPSTTNKANAIRKLLDIVDLPTDIVTIGDSLNDVEMLKDFSGYAITGSKIATLYPEFKNTPSVAAFIESTI